ncbi:Sphingosine kinase 1, partial [Ophiophagus hannah]
MVGLQFLDLLSQHVMLTVNLFTLLILGRRNTWVTSSEVSGDSAAEPTEWSRRGPASIYLSKKHNHAWDLAREEDMSKWDAVVIMAGDGLLHEVINGLMERPDWKTAIQKPLCILPGGSGNALAASLNHYARQTLHLKFCSEHSDSYAAFFIAHHQPKAYDNPTWSSIGA